MKLTITVDEEGVAIEMDEAITVDKSLEFSVRAVNALRKSAVQVLECAGLDREEAKDLFDRCADIMKQDDRPIDGRTIIIQGNK